MAKIRMEDLTKFITLREASKLTGYNSDYLSSLIRSGKIRGQKVGRGWVTTRHDLDTYFNQPAPVSSVKVISQKFKVAAISLAAAFIATLIFTGIYMSIYQHGYSEAKVEAASTATTTSSEPLNASQPIVN